MQRTTILLLVLAATLLIGCTTATQQATDQSTTEQTDQTSPINDWRDIDLKDVNTGNTFTINELEKPVLLESFAIWCPNCLRQQKTIRDLTEEMDISVVAHHVDPNEDEAAVKAYADKNGFTWSYVVAPTTLTQQLIDEFGTGVVVAPQEPIILVCDEGARLLKRGHKSVNELKDELAKGCAA